MKSRLNSHAHGSDIRPGSRHGPLTAHPVRDRRVVERRHRTYTRHRQLSGPTLYAAQRHSRVIRQRKPGVLPHQVIRIQPVRRTLGAAARCSR